MPIVEADADLRSRLLARIESKPDEVWTPGDFADLGARAAVDKTLQRLAAAGELRRIDRGLYDRPRTNNLTGRATVPDYRAVIRAVTRRDRARAVIDGMTAANDLGLTTAVPARLEVLVDARLKPIKLGTQEIHFKYAAPCRLYWADRPGMRVVQALRPDPKGRAEAYPGNVAPPVCRPQARRGHSRGSARRSLRRADLDAGVPPRNPEGGPARRRSHEYRCLPPDHRDIPT
ncbi:DUF6088 family protein [Mesorhizobium sp. M0488]|uniref:DUF6088 family protein n=1 Tax=unclassified Mesorhizobium TaxID=325217 RepID=UPI003335BE38